MEIINLILLWCVSTGEVALCYFLADCLTDPQLLKHNKVYFTFMILLFGTLLFTNRMMSEIVSWVMLIAESIWISSSMLVKSRKEPILKYGVVLVSKVCFAILQLFCAFTEFMVLSNIEIRKIYSEFSWLRTSCYIFSIVIVWCIYKLWMLRHENIVLLGNQYKWSFLMYGLAGILFIMIFQNRLLEMGRYRSLETLVFFVLIVINELLVFFGSTKAASIRSKMDSLELSEKLMKESYEEIREMYQNYSITYHDFKNHLIVLKEYCNIGELQKAAWYIEKISSPLQQLKKYVHLENEILEVIINYKLKKAEEKGIRLEINTDLVEINRVEEEDLCIILSNLLDNAIEACLAVPQNNRWISFYFRNLGDLVIIKISNSFCRKSGTTQSFLNMDGVEKKIHGYGKKSVKKAVEKYGGQVHWNRKENTYSVTVQFEKGEN